jgi:hypothetical protein
MRRIKTFESFSTTFEEYTLEVSDFLKGYNLFPDQISYLLDQYSGEIEIAYGEGRYSKEVADGIAKDLKIGSGGFMQISMRGGGGWQNAYYK